MSDQSQLMLLIVVGTALCTGGLALFFSFADANIHLQREQDAMARRRLAFRRVSRSARIAAIAILTFLILQPALRHDGNSNGHDVPADDNAHNLMSRGPRVALLIDDSASMQQRDADVNTVAGPDHGDDDAARFPGTEEADTPQSAGGLAPVSRSQVADELVGAISRSLAAIGLPPDRLTMHRLSDLSSTAEPDTYDSHETRRTEDLSRPPRSHRTEHAGSPLLPAILTLARTIERNQQSSSTAVNNTDTASIILPLTDGRDTSPLLPHDIADSLRQSGTPVTVHPIMIGPGTPNETTNRRVMVHAGPEPSMHGRSVPLRIRVDLENDQTAGPPPVLSIMLDGELIAEHQIDAWVDSEQILEAEITPTIRPQPDGTRPAQAFMICTVSVSASPNETFTADNTRSIILDVRTSPLEVLALENEPYWDTRFLIESLIEDPELSVTSVVGLGENVFIRRYVAEPGQTQDTMPTEHESAHEQTAAAEATNGGANEVAALLDRTNVLILGRGVERWFSTPAARAQLRDWMSRPGAGVVFARGLPRLDIASPTESQVFIAELIGESLPMAASVTRASPVAATLHPPLHESRIPGHLSRSERIADLRESGTETTEPGPRITVHSTVPAGSGNVNVLLSARLQSPASPIDADTTHGTETAPQSPPAVPAVISTPLVSPTRQLQSDSDEQSGRAVVVLADDLWRWARIGPGLTSASRVGSDVPDPMTYTDFWRQVIRSLGGRSQITSDATSPDAESPIRIERQTTAINVPMQITVDPHRFATPEETWGARTNDQPEDAQSPNKVADDLRIAVIDPTGRQVTLPLSLPQVDDRSGSQDDTQVTVEFIPNIPGVHRIQPIGSQVAHRWSNISVPFIAEMTDRESADTSTNFELMQQLATITGGRAFTPRESDELISLLRAEISAADLSVNASRKEGNTDSDDRDRHVVGHGTLSEIDERTSTGSTLLNAWMLILLVSLVLIDWRCGVGAARSSSTETAAGRPRQSGTGTDSSTTGSL